MLLQFGLSLFSIPLNLFCDTPDGAEASAIAYSFAEMALANKLNVFSYIKYVLEQRPNENMDDSEPEKLMPWNENVIELCRLEK